MKERKHQAYVDTYVNPIKIAQEYKEMLSKDGFNQSQLATKLGISRVRVSQILNLLNLPNDKQDYVLQHGHEEMITERQLRSLIV